MEGLGSRISLQIVGLDDHAVLAEIPVPGRTRWAVYDPAGETFFVNTAERALIVAVPARAPYRTAHAFTIPAAGPHGLDLDLTTERLFCACDAKKLVALDLRSGKVEAESELSGVPDVIFFSQALGRLYVAIGEPRFQATSKNDFENMARQFPAYDALYAYCREKVRRKP